jgi:hypothetical protein
MQFALLGDGHLRHLPGGVDEYLRLRQLSLGSASQPKAVRKASQAASSASSKGLPAGSSARRDAEKNLARIERALEKLGKDEAELHLKMAAFDQSDFDGLAKLVVEQNLLNEKREELELEWLDAQRHRWVEPRKLAESA